MEMKGNVAIMSVRTFYLPAIEDGGQNYEEFFRKSFAEIAANRTKNLIIDLRNNHGGSDPVGMALMSYLHDSTFYYYKRRSAIVKPDRHARAVRKGSMYEIKGKGVWTGRVTPAKDVYKGTVYVLMNGYSVSATGEFIGHLKSINRAIFIGEEAGGNPVAFTGGVSLPIDLPHSRVTGTIPLQFVEMNVRLKNTGHGVAPNYEVHPGINDILEERDLELELALKLIRKEN
jgi:C-terminal processing protease CtpA/Prc